MSPIQSNLNSLFKIDGTAPVSGNMPPVAAPGTPSTSSTPASGSNDEVRPAWYRRAIPGPPAQTPPQGEKQDPFFAVIEKLMDQLDAMIGQLLGGATPGTGTPTVPGTTAAPGDGSGTATLGTSDGIANLGTGDGTATLGTGAGTANLGTGDGIATPTRLRNSPDMLLA